MDVISITLIMQWHTNYIGKNNVKYCVKSTHSIESERDSTGVGGRNLSVQSCYGIKL